MTFALDLFDVHYAIHGRRKDAIRGQVVDFLIYRLVENIWSLIGDSHGEGEPILLLSPCRHPESQHKWLLSKGRCREFMHVVPFHFGHEHLMPVTRQNHNVGHFFHRVEYLLTLMLVAPPQIP